MNYEIEMIPESKMRVRIVSATQEAITSAIAEMEEQGFYPKHIKCDGQKEKVTIWFI